MRLSNAIRTVALFEAAKGALVLVSGVGLLSLVHRDAQHLAERIVAHFHLNPASRYPRIFLEMAGQLTDPHLLLIAAGAMAYSVVRFVEAYELWHAKRWAEWFATASGAIYVPFELLELYSHTGWLSLAALLLNIGVVAIMLYAVVHPSRAREPTP
jgi:uncharacterized membrane protein (DUF2068 family)